jgi:hypothetical protein
MESENNVEKKNIMIQTVIRLILKYVIEGLIITITAYYIPIMYKTSLRKPTFNEIFSIGLTASLTMLLLDIFANNIGVGVRLGAGLGIGQKLVGF